MDLFDPHPMVPALRNSPKSIVAHDKIAEMLRALNYQQGVDKLKHGMVPVIAGHDYVPPTAQFNDTPTLQDNVRAEAQGAPTYNYLKALEMQMNNDVMRPTPPAFTPYPMGYNSNDRT